MAESRETVKGKEVPTPQLVVRRLATPDQPRQYHVVDAFGPVKFDVFTPNISAIERAVTERVYYVKEQGVLVRPPQPSVNVVKRLCGFQERLDEQLVKVHGKFARWSLERTVAHYSGQKRKLYEKARVQYMKRGYKTSDANVEAFLKWEKINSTPSTKSWSERVCRVISPRSPVYRLLLGSYLLGIEKKVIEGVDRVLAGYRPPGWHPLPTVLKGLDTFEMARVVKEKFDRFNNPVVVMTDATRWDQHVSKPQLRWEHRQYLKFFAHTKQKEFLRKLLNAQLDNKCKGKARGGEVEYEVEGTRMSGDINTSMGNCLLMVANMVSVLDLMAIDDFELGNNGDDTFIIMEAPVYNARFKNDVFTKLWRDVGFNMKLEGVAYILEQISFCQTRPVYDGLKYRMVREIEPVLTKDCISLKPLQNPKMRAAYLWNISAGGLALTHGIPVMQSFYEAFKRGALRYTNNKRMLNKYNTYFNEDRFNYNYLVADNTTTVSPVDSDARVSFALAFDVSPAHQRVIENNYNKLILDVNTVTNQPTDYLEV